MKRAVKYSLLFLIPVLLTSTVLIGQSYWQKSIKNDDADVSQHLYTVVLSDSTNPSNADTYAGLEFDSAFELPMVTSTGFSGWRCSNNNQIYQPDYYVYSDIAGSASLTTITFVAQY